MLGALGARRRDAIEVVAHKQSLQDVLDLDLIFWVCDGDGVWRINIDRIEEQDRAMGVDGLMRRELVLVLGAVDDFLALFDRLLSASI